MAHQIPLKTCQLERPTRAAREAECVSQQGEEVGNSRKKNGQGRPEADPALPCSAYDSERGS